MSSDRRRLVLPWVVWGVAVLAQTTAIIHRSSLSALGPATQRHFDIDATTLSMFAVVQLIFIASLQVPIGTLLDRYGSAVMIISGSLIMAIGQVVMATAPDVTLALVARAFVGAGDGCIFVSVIRMLPEWFSLGQIPVVTQLSGLFGQAGQIISVAPFAFGVSVFGWATGFLGLAGLGIFIAIVCFFVLRDRPRKGTSFERLTGRTGRATREARAYAGFESTAALRLTRPPETALIVTVGPDGQPTRAAGRALGRVRDLMKLPGMRLAFWLLFTPAFALTTLFMLWGTPFFTGGLGYSPETSSTLLSLAVVVCMAAGLVMGPVVSRFRRARIKIVFCIAAAVMITWMTVLLWPGQPPFWLVVALVVVTPLGGPASNVGFDEARLSSPRSYLGLATSVVNVAAFLSPLIAMLLIGVVLDLLGAGSPELYSLDAFRWAMMAMLPIWLTGLTGIAIESRRTKHWAQHREQAAE